MSITSEEKKIIDLENENSFLKDNLYEEQEQNEYLKDKVEKQQKEIEEMREELQMYVDVQNNDIYNYISKDKIKEWLDRFELEEELQDKYDEFLGSQAIYKFLKKLLEEK